MADKPSDNRTDGNVDQAKLHRQIGQLAVEVDFLKKIGAAAAADKRKLNRAWRHQAEHSQTV